ncbi:MAG: hypothetical protein VXY66_07465, partial [Pseudomonadota bacterium]|nr:hypothetical protein [Pseudomonadota bacterium]
GIQPPATVICCSPSNQMVGVTICRRKIGSPQIIKDASLLKGAAIICLHSYLYCKRCAAIDKTS